MMTEDGSKIAFQIVYGAVVRVNAADEPGNDVEMDMTPVEARELGDQLVNLANTIDEDNRKFQETDGPLKVEGK